MGINYSEYIRGLGETLYRKVNAGDASPTYNDLADTYVSDLLRGVSVPKSMRQLMEDEAYDALMHNGNRRSVANWAHKLFREEGRHAVYHPVTQEWYDRGCDVPVTDEEARQCIAGFANGRRAAVGVRFVVDLADSFDMLWATYRLMRKDNVRAQAKGVNKADEEAIRIGALDPQTERLPVGDVPRQPALLLNP